MPRRAHRMTYLTACCLLIPVLSCNELAGLLGNGVTIIIENNTSYTAVPDLRTSASRNLIEDILEKGDRVTGFGINGAILPNQTVTIRLVCDSDIELIAFGGADFREGNSISVGDVDDNTRLRRDSDFDCGDVVRIRLEGGIFNFAADVNVERSWNSNTGSNHQGGSNDDTANFLDDLFG